MIPYHPDNHKPSVEHKFRRSDPAKYFPWAEILFGALILSALFIWAIKSFIID